MAIVFTNSTNYDMSGRRRKAKKPKGEVYAKYKPEFKPYVPTPTYRRGSSFDECQSKSIDSGIAIRKDSPRYTGTLVTGIATMHKSNAVPVISQEQATDIARMRRG